jgi:hypothetical protein
MRLRRAARCASGAIAVFGLKPIRFDNVVAAGAVKGAVKVECRLPRTALRLTRHGRATHGRQATTSK